MQPGMAKKTLAPRRHRENIFGEIGNKLFMLNSIQWNIDHRLQKDEAKKSKSKSPFFFDWANLTMEICQHFQAVYKI